MKRERTAKGPRVPMSKDKDLLTYLLILRYGSAKGSMRRPPILNFKSIATIVHLPVQTVRRLLSVAKEWVSSDKDLRLKTRTKLEDHHKEYLLHPETLRAWAHLSLKQRAVMFHRQFPEIRISASLLHRTYRANGVRFKYIQKVKKEIDYTTEYYLGLFKKMHLLIKLAKLYEFKIVFIDEAVFTFNTFNTKAWAGPYKSIKVNEQNLRVRTQAIIAAISEEVGLEHVMIRPRAINGEHFIEFLEQLREKSGDQYIVLFMDNLQVHKTKEVKAAYERLKYSAVFNLPYSPDFNGIESYFSLVKGHYKKLLLQIMMKGETFDVVSLIK